jgi:mannitol-1-phosphate/altronate dehydrogenase
MNGVRVCEANLERLAGLGAGIPRYDRQGLKKRMVHLGLGHFHRAHQALYVDDLLNRGLTDTGIMAVNLIPDVYPLGETAAEQDYLYSLTARGTGGEEDIRVVGSILGYLNAASRPEEGLELLSRPETALISLTITEKGYCYDTVKGDLAWEGDLLHDVRHPEAPRTAIGFLAAALDRRRLAGGGLPAGGR